MKRRKTLNKYRVNDRGQITNTQPTLSPKVRQLLEFSSFMSALSNYNDDTTDVEVDENAGGETTDTVCD